MSWEFVVGIIFAILTAVVFVLYRSAKNELKDLLKSERYDRAEVTKVTGEAASFKLGAIALGIVTALFMGFASAYIVPVRNVGIVTEFNRPTGSTTGSGLSWVWPWQDVEDFDASVITIGHLGKWNEGCTVVRIGSLATACVENRVQLQVTESGAPKLFLDYKGDFENVRKNLYETVIQNALNDVFSTYNPLSQVNLTTGQVGFDGTKLQEDVKAKLAAALGSDVTVRTVSIPLVHHDAQTEKNIQQFQDVVAQNRVLAQKQANATAEKQVSDKLRAVLTDLYVKNKCIEESVKMGVPPGLCLVGGGAIVNATGGK